MYAEPHQMEPMLPKRHRAQLEELATELLRRSAALGGRLPGPTRRTLVEVLRQMNSYYSNLIEGHNTHPLEIERALNRDLSNDPAQRELQLESLAHVEVQRRIEERLRLEPELVLTSIDFLSWVHAEFYALVPDGFRVIRDSRGEAHSFEPGELRKRDVEVGRHIPPTSSSVPEFMRRFQEAYDQSKLGPLERIYAAAAAHHRFAWIHPFQDGNGRVARLFTDAWFAKACVDSHGLWTISRGLGRNATRYKQMLARADEPRMGDYDGRGNLSDRALGEFSVFFLETALDQVEFMSGLLDFGTVHNRIRGYVERRAAANELRPQAFHVIWQALLEGEIARGEVGRIAGMPDRTARLLIGELLSQGLLLSDSPKGLLRLGLPLHAVAYYFPRLFPEGIEESLLASAPPPLATTPRPTARGNSRASTVRRQRGHRD
ncbi:Fic family protein [Vulgatibacter sp.]|uniref:Fic family protein n=1 Tax=Vulgatibacter sp. TaxID=1971226 RepID=UPI003563A718